MAKFVTFDDGFGTYNFRAIFSSNTPKGDILKSVERKLVRRLKKRGLEREDFDWGNLKEFTSITNMKDGVFYEPDFGHWND